MSEAYAAYLNRQYMEDYLKGRGIPAYVFHHYLGSVVRVPTPDFNASTHIKTEIIAYVCPHCGALNYGQWGIPQLELTFNPKYPSETAYRLQDLQEANIMYEFGEKNNHVELLVEVGLEADKNNRLCGICGQTLSSEPGYKKQCSLVKPLPSISDFENLFDDMKKTIDELEQAASNQAVQEILNNSLSSLPQSNSTSLSSEIESTPQRLKEYLQYLFRMEMNIYSLSKHLSSLYFKRYQIERTITLKHAVSKIELEKKLSEAKSAYQECLNAPDPENIIPLEVDSVPDPIKPIEPTAPTLKKPGFFNKKKILAENALLTADYEQALLQYEKDCRIYDEKMKRADDERKRNLELATKVKEIKVRDARKEQQQKTQQALETLNQLQAEASATPLSGIKELLAKEISDAEKLLKSTIECKNRLYSYDIVFKKYHSIIPLATFCEYLESSRCTTLQGNDGAYNLYEVECRANRIIDQLSQIITSLDQIKSNQYLIYSELCVVNENLSSLDDKMSCVIRYLDKNNMYLENISANSETIAYNSEVAAYYSKKNAELTNAMGYLIALK